MAGIVGRSRLRSGSFFVLGASVGGLFTEISPEHSIKERKGKRLRKQNPRCSTVAFRTSALKKIRTIRAIDVIANVVINSTHAPHDPEMLIVIGAAFHSFVE
jgi:hypothetical protein